MKYFGLSFFAFILVSCASNPTTETVKYVTNIEPGCVHVGSFSAIGFSIIPPVASAVAKSMLEKKAIEMRANTLQIKKDTGIFQVVIEAFGYRCSEIKPKPLKK